jgi:hypothetical protein
MTARQLIHQVAAASARQSVDSRAGAGISVSPGEHIPGGYEWGDLSREIETAAAAAGVSRLALARAVARLNAKLGGPTPPSLWFVAGEFAARAEEALWGI